MERKCSGCKRKKPSDAFSPRQGKCRECRNRLRANGGTKTPRLYVDAAPVIKAMDASRETDVMIADRVGLDYHAVHDVRARKKIAAAKASAILFAIGVLPAEIGL